jgi:hypothetical protein
MEWSEQERALARDRVARARLEREAIAREQERLLDGAQALDRQLTRELRKAERQAPVLQHVEPVTREEFLAELESYPRCACGCERPLRPGRRYVKGHATRRETIVLEGIEHGSSGYRSGCRCPECRRAQAAYSRAYRARKRKAA